MEAFGEGFEEELLSQIYQKWRGLTRARGEMDGMMDALRRETQSHLGQTLARVTEVGDELIDQHAADGGLKAAQAGFNQLEDAAREHLNGAEDLRQRGEQLCLAHRIPKTSPVASAREEVVRAAEDKPELDAMKFGALVWVLMAPGLGAPICYLIAGAAGLYRNPNPVEFALGPLGWLVGGLALALPALWLMYRHMSELVERVERAIESLADTARSVVEGAGSSLAGSPSIRSFIEARLQLTAALNVRNYAMRVYERVVQDAHLAHRLSRSIDIQEDALKRRAEDLGVRAQMGRGSARETSAEDDVSQLFSARDGHALPSLVPPERLGGFYKSRYGEEKELQALVPIFIDDVGGFGEWRKHACMSDTALIMGYSRAKFDAVVERPVAEQYTFADAVGEALEEFVSQRYSNVGFGAKFSGYEGLDPDGVRILCDVALVMHPALTASYEEARRRPGAKPFTETQRVIETEIRPNTAYMLSFVQGIRPHCLRNLMRFESFHDRATIPDDRTFPLSGEAEGRARPINHMTGFEGLRDDIHARVIEVGRERALSGPGMAGEPISALRVGIVDVRELIPIEDLEARNYE